MTGLRDNFSKSDRYFELCTNSNKYLHEVSCLFKLNRSTADLFFTRKAIDYYNDLRQKLEQCRKSPIDIGRTASSMAILVVKFSS